MTLTSKNNSQSKHWHSALNGAITGIISRTCTSPLDVVKIRLQLQQKSIASPRKYTTVASTFKTIYREEGIKAFWKGNLSGLYLYASYNAIQFYSYHVLKSMNARLQHEFNVLWTSGASGALAAFISTSLTYPFDLLRTRYALHGTGVTHIPLLYTIRRIHTQEGPKGFYKGLGMTLMQVVPYMGIVFATFEACNRAFFTLENPPSPSLSNMLSGMIAGLVSKTLLMPVDVIRKRLQIQGSDYKVYVRDVNLPRYYDWRDCIKTMWRVEGIRGFYSGLSVALLKSVPGTAITLVTYHALQHKMA